MCKYGQHPSVACCIFEKAVSVWAELECRGLNCLQYCQAEREETRDVATLCMVEHLALMLILVMASSINDLDIDLESSVTANCCLVATRNGSSLARIGILSI